MSMKISQTCVRRKVRMHMSEHRSLRAARMSDCLPRPMLIDPPLMAALIGVKKPRAAGRMMDAWRSLPTTVWRTFRGTDFQWRIRCISLMYAAAFAGGRRTVRLIPSNKKPIISLLLVKLPLPLSSLGFEMGSFPSTCPVTSGWGKYEWMP